MPSVTTEFLKDLQNLSKQENQTIQKFENDPTGASFMPVADMLRKRGYVEEAIVILEDGVFRYPQYSSARAALARDYFNQGMFEEALKASQEVVSRAPDNTLAQRINLKVLVLFNRREEALSRLKAIAKIAPDDALTNNIRKAVSFGDWASAQRWVKVELERAGISAEIDRERDLRAASSPAEVPLFPESGGGLEQEPGSPQSPSPSAGLPSAWSVPAEVRPQQPQKDQESDTEARVGAESGQYESVLKQPAHKTPESLRPGSSLGHIDGDIDRYLLLKGFRSVSLSGYLVGRGQASSRFGGVEKQTMAEIYRSQGLHLKALEIYESLIQEDPNNMEYQSAYGSIRQLMKEEFLSEENKKVESHQDPRPGALPASESSLQPLVASKAEVSDADVEESSKKLKALREMLSNLDSAEKSDTSSGGTSP